MTPEQRDGFTPLLTWLHLSDIHTGHGGRWRQADQELVLERATADIRRSTAAAPPFDVILITGDVAATGATRARNEFRRFDAWLTPIVAHAGLSPACIFAVPGNHDVERESLKSAAKAAAVIAGLREAGGIDDAIGNRASHAILARRQDGFRRWARPYGSTTDATVSAFAWRHERDLAAGLKLRIVGLNTALLSANDDDEGRLELGAQQLLETLGRPEPDPREIVVVLGHHPLTWLRDTLDAQGWIGSRAHIYLCGHVHEAGSVRAISGTGTELITISVGALHEPSSQAERHPRHGYNVASVGLRYDGVVVVRVWARRWSDPEKRFEVAPAKDDRSFAEHELAVSAADPAAPPSRRRPGSGASAKLTLDDIAEVALRHAGKRRTAYPSDMSFAELHRSDLQIAPVLRDGANILDLVALAKAVHCGNSALLLGEPGSGKSFAAYLLLDHLAVADLTAIPVDVRDLQRTGRATSVRLTRAVMLRTVARRLGGTTTAIDDDKRSLIVVVDGVDEALNTGQLPEVIAERLQELARIGALLVTCRTREYRDLLATRLTGIDLIVSTQPWEFDDHFVRFVGKLERAGRLHSAAEVIAAARAPGLRELVSRPLFARMLTFVIESGGSVSDRPSLYRAYLSGLAAATRATLVQAGHGDVDVYQQWRDVAWWAFVNSRVSEDGVPLTPILAFLADQGVATGTALRLLSTLTDSGQVFDELRVSFLHFSYFEYLLAEEAATRLRRDAGGLAPVGQNDLTVEVRHFMTAIIAGTTDDGLPGRIAASYGLSYRLDNEQQLTVNNLLVYLLARWPTPQALLLDKLLAREDQPFLRASLYWALAGAGSPPALAQFIGLLRSDPEMGELNRGYLLYYYGDLDRSQPPPYRDTAPHRPWPSTRRRTIEMMREAAYAAITVTRRLLDVATFVDLLSVRSEQPAHDEHGTLAKVLEDARANSDDPIIDEVIVDLFTRIGGTQLAWPLEA